MKMLFAGSAFTVLPYCNVKNLSDIVCNFGPCLLQLMSVLIVSMFKVSNNTVVLFK